VTPSKAERSKPDSGDRSWSLTKTCVALAFAWAYLVWGLAANAYHVVESRLENERVTGGYTSPRSLIALFIAESFAELPKAGQVISYAVAERKWIPCLLVVGEVGLVGFWFMLTRLERRMALDDRRRGRR
jgi:hypothetical protein